MSGLDEMPGHLHEEFERVRKMLVSYGKCRRKKRGKELPEWALSTSGVRCALLLDVWLNGLHHLPRHRGAHKMDWSGGFVELVWHDGFAGLSTADPDGLTRLVILAHDHSIRVEINARSRGFIEILLHPRPVAPVGKILTTRHHPDMNDLRDKIDNVVSESLERLRGG